MPLHREAAHRASEVEDSTRRPGALRHEAYMERRHQGDCAIALGLHRPLVCVGAAAILSPICHFEEPKATRNLEMTSIHKIRPAQQLQLFDANESSTQDKPVTGARLPWAWLLKRVFRVDVTVCPRCQASLKVTELVIKRDEIAKRLAQQGLGPMPPPAPLPKVRGQLALRLDFD